VTRELAPDKIDEDRLVEVPRPLSRLADRPEVPPILVEDLDTRFLPVEGVDPALIVGGKVGDVGEGDGTAPFVVTYRELLFEGEQVAVENRLGRVYDDRHAIDLFDRSLPRALVPGAKGRQGHDPDQGHGSQCFHRFDPPLIRRC
jgi:hypothetical protein